MDNANKCDLVLKGGITSGVVYPRLITQLSKHYRFQNIGGASAGAIAAAGCAAAEYARQTGKGTTGFTELDKLADQLGKSGYVRRLPKRSMLLGLFQPSAALRDHFEVLVAGLNAKSTGAGIASITGAVLWRQWPLTLLTVASGAALCVPTIVHVVAWGEGWAVVLGALAGVVATLIVATFVAVAQLVWFVFTLLRGLKANHLGVCSGHSETNEPPALTDWLTTYLNTLADLAPDAPLTFGHLWQGGKTTLDASNREINLEVMTTAVTQHTCFAIPFREGTGGYLYDPLEWAKLFPKSVMQWLDKVEAGAPSAACWLVTCAEGEQPVEKILRRLPANHDLPVVVAVRMSLSFPVLLSAMPLYARDWSEKGQSVKRVWFSDGGIASNLPLHFFDAMLPCHPTFIVNLKSPHPKFPIAKDRYDCTNPGGRIYLPEDNHGGRQRYWPPPKTAPLHGFLGFVGSIVETMQNWRDELHFPYPGYRDRIVQISLEDDEGGLNLDMPEATITKLGAAGACAGNRLVTRFHPDYRDSAKHGWDEHRKFRLRTFLALMEDLVRDERLTEADWDTVLAQAYATEYPDDEEPKAQAAKKRHEQAEDILATLRVLGARANGRGNVLARRAPNPRPVLRIMPRV